MRDVRWMVWKLADIACRMFNTRRIDTLQQRFPLFAGSLAQESSRLRYNCNSKSFAGELELCGPERVAVVQVSTVEAAREPAGALLGTVTLSGNLQAKWPWPQRFTLRLPRGARSA